MVFKLQDNGGNLSGKEFVIFGRTIAEMKQASAEGERFGGIFKSKVVLPVKNAEKIIENYNKAVKNSTLDQDIFNKVVAKDSLTKHLQTLKGAPATLDKYTASLSTMTIKARAAELGMKALKIAGNMLLMLGISELISIPYRIAEANKEAVANANEGAKALDEESKSIDGYKEKISELQTALQSGNLTQGEAYDKRKELISIQDELIGKYGTEKDVVDKVTAAIKGNVNVLDEFNEKSWNSWYSKNNTSGFLQTISGSGSAISKAKNFIEGNNDAYYQGQFTGTTKSKNIYDILSKDKIEQIGNDNGLYTSLGTEAGVFLGGTPEKMLSALKEFRTQYIEALQGQFPATWEDEAKASLSSIDNQIQYFQKGVDTYKLTYQTYMQGKIAYESEYSDEYATILEKRSALEEAQLSGDVENTKKAKSELFYSLTDAMTESKDDAAVLKYFNEMYPELQSEFKKWKFEIGFEANTDNLKTEVSNALSDLEGLDDQGILNIGQIEGTENQEAAYDGLCKSAKKYGMEIKDLIALLVEWGLVQGKVVDEAPPLAQFNVSTLTSGIDALKASSETIAKAYAEMNSKSGELSLDTAKELITLDKDYLALLDTKNGKITIGTNILEQQFEIEKKKQTVSLETEKAKLIASQAAIKSAIDSANAEILAMSAVYNMSDSIYRDAMAKLGKSKSDLAENKKGIVDVDKALSVLNTISLNDVTSGVNKLKGATDGLKKSSESINSLLTMAENMLKQQYTDEKERIGLLVDELKKKYDKEKSDIEEVSKAKKKQYDKDKQALEDELDGYRKKIKSQLELLKSAEADRDYKTELDDKKKSVSDLEADLAIKKLDLSETGKRKTLEIEQELADKRKELDEFQHDNSIEKQEDALNKELDSFEEKTNNKIDILDKEQKLYDDMHDARLEQMEKEYKRQNDIWEEETKAITKQISNEYNIRMEAIALIEGRSGEFYNNLLTWNMQYGTHTNATVTQAWQLAYAELDKFNVKQLGVQSVLETLALRMFELDNKTSGAANSANNLNDAYSSVRDTINEAVSSAEKLALGFGPISDNYYNSHKNDKPDNPFDFKPILPKRYHTGGIVDKNEVAPDTLNAFENTFGKLMPNEVPAILKDKEMVVPEHLIEAQRKPMFGDTALMRIAATQHALYPDGRDITEILKSSLKNMPIMHYNPLTDPTNPMSQINNYVNSIPSQTNANSDITIKNELIIQGNVDKDAFPGIQKMLDMAAKHTKEDILHQEMLAGRGRRAKHCTF